MKGLNCGPWGRGCGPSGPYLTAYDIARKHGFTGTEEEWLASIGTMRAIHVTDRNGESFTCDTSLGSIRQMLENELIPVLITMEGLPAFLSDMTGEVISFSTMLIRDTEGDFYDCYSFSGRERTVGKMTVAGTGGGGSVGPGSITFNLLNQRLQEAVTSAESAVQPEELAELAAAIVKANTAVQPEDLFTIKGYGSLTDYQADAHNVKTGDFVLITEETGPHLYRRTGPGSGYYGLTLVYAFYPADADVSWADVKPDGGVTIYDLANDVQLSLHRADDALPAASYKPQTLGIGIAQSTTQGGTVPKTATLAGYVLKENGLLAVHFNTPVEAGATLSVYDGQAWTAAIPISHHGSAIAGGVITYGDTALFVFDGTNYQLLCVDNGTQNFGTANAGKPLVVGSDGAATAGQWPASDGAGGTVTWGDVLPPNGVPITDLAEGVRTSLGRADAALPAASFLPAKLGGGLAVSTTQGGTVPKTAALAGYELKENGLLAVKFTTPVEAGATLSITPDNGVSYTTPKSIYYHGAAIAADVIGYGDTALFVYDGTNYELLAVNTARANPNFGSANSGKPVVVGADGNPAAGSWPSSDGQGGTVTWEDILPSGGIPLTDLANQGSANANKVLGIGSDGSVTPTPSAKILTMTKSNSTYTYTGANFTFSTLADLQALVQAGIMIWLVNMTTGSAYRSVNSRGAASLARLTFAGATLESDSDDLTVEAFVLNGSMEITKKTLSASGGPVSWNDLLPSGGIPKTDLAQAVQTSLGKADTALQDSFGTANAGKPLVVGSNGKGTVGSWPSGGGGSYTRESVEAVYTVGQNGTTLSVALGHDDLISKIEAGARLWSEVTEGQDTINLEWRLMGDNVTQDAIALSAKLEDANGEHLLVAYLTEVNSNLMSGGVLSQLIGDAKAPKRTPKNGANPTAFALYDNEIYTCGTVESLTITNVASDAECMLVFTSGSTPTNLSLPSHVVFASGSPDVSEVNGVKTFLPTANALYELTFMNRRCAISKYEV